MTFYHKVTTKHKLYRAFFSSRIKWFAQSIGSNEKEDWDVSYWNHMLAEYGMSMHQVQWLDVNLEAVNGYNFEFRDEADELRFIFEWHAN